MKIHDKTLPWKISLVREAALKPFKTVSTFFQSYLKTFEEVYWPWQKGNKK